MSEPTIAAELDALAERIARIRPVGQNGDASPFYEDRSEVAHDARLLARWQRTGQRPAEFVLAADRRRDSSRTSYRERR